MIIPVAIHSGEVDFDGWHSLRRRRLLDDVCVTSAVDSPDVEDEFVVVEEGEYIADAKIDIDELSDKLGVIIPKEDYDTLGGFLVHMSNKIPAVDDVINYENITFTIIEADERRVAKVGIKMEPPAEKETNLQIQREE